MNASKIVLATLALAGAMATGAAHARSNVDVQWSVNIGGPIGVSLYSDPQRVYMPAPVVVQPSYGYQGYYAPQPVYPSQPVYAPQPVYVQPGYGHTPYRRGWGDRDHDGIPNRYDRVYNPPWDRNGDGVPDRYEHHHRDHDRDGRHGR